MSYSYSGNIQVIDTKTIGLLNSFSFYNGNVGIGTTQPTAKLEVAGNLNTTAYLKNHVPMNEAIMYNSSTTTTISQPSNYSFVRVQLWGAGGGGGGGCQNVSLTTSAGSSVSGGAGGGGGAYAEFIIPYYIASHSLLEVSVGQGGAAGIGGQDSNKTTAGTVLGSAGTAGGSTIFTITPLTALPISSSGGFSITVGGGAGGARGVSAAGSAGGSGGVVSYGTNTGATFPADNGGFAVAGGAGGNGTNGGAGNDGATNIAIPCLSGSGGGGGGGRPASTTYGRTSAGDSGYASLPNTLFGYFYNSATLGLRALGDTIIAPDIIDIPTQPGFNYSNTLSGGTGGGGGFGGTANTYLNTGVTDGNIGSSGGFPAGAGGGGGSGKHIMASGEYALWGWGQAGGQGGDGLCLITFY